MTRSNMFRIFILFLMALLLSNPLTSGFAAPDSQALTPADQARSLLEQLTPEEKVGQLFLVTFQGKDVGPESPIYELITRYFIGGVVLTASNDNFSVGDQSLSQSLTLNRQIQQDRLAASQSERTDPFSGASFQPSFIPLFIGTQQEGDGFPYDQILSAMTPLPNEMAIGATWNPDLARQVGSVQGSELSALGFNLQLGPSLDVLENPDIYGTYDLGTRTFGGDPFWVGQMASAYIEGLHQGSDGRVAVVAKHFPGIGGSDRLPDTEVATVRKSLEELKTFDLAPFFAVTGDAASPESTTDALLATHTRYQGFQGDSIRDTTRPVSMDRKAFDELMLLPSIDAWRKNGGVMVSDDLGNQAMRGYYELTNPGQVFDPRRVALNSFLAGNDLLFIADFTSGEIDSHTSAVRTLEFFAQKYRDDPAFASSVDTSVLRILTLKYRLYGNFNISSVLNTMDSINTVGQSGQVTFEVAQQAATLISPSQADLDNEIPDPPNLNDRIVFLTDARTTQQCNQCPREPLLDVHALEEVVLRRYGPLAGGQVSPNFLSSYSLNDLQQVLDAGFGETELERDLSRTNWIVFAVLDNSAVVPSIQTLSRFLAERPDLFQQKRLIVFAFNAPYYLDATNITKLTAYYGLYSKAPQFVDVAAYLLFRDFRELRPSGALPVSVPGTGYDLNRALFPDPSQVIPLWVETAMPEEPDGAITPQPAPPLEFRIGDVIPLRTGVILDHNGNLVPDGTPVEFSMTLGAETTVSNQVTTVNGVARTAFTVPGPGKLQLAVQSDLARSEPLTFDIPAPNGELVVVTPTETPTPTATPTLTPTVTPPTEAALVEQPPSRPSLADWVIAFLMAAAIAWSAYRLLALIGQVRWGVRGGFLALIGGLTAYCYLVLGMPGSEKLMNGSISRGVFLVTLLGAFVGLFITWSWRLVGSSLNNK